MFLIKIVSLLFMMPLVVLAAQDTPVMTNGQVAVSHEDIERYIVDNVPQEASAKAGILNRAGIYLEMAEALYTLRVLAAEAEGMPDFDHEQAKWAAHMTYQRRLMEDYRIKYVRQQLKDVNWEASALETYQVQKDNYRTPEQVNASHILITLENRSDEEALALAAAVRERALQGENFGELAHQYSEDPSAASNAGNMGFFRRGQTAKPFEDAAFAMREPKSISDVVKTQFGYHVIKYHSRKKPAPAPFDSVKHKIMEELQTQMGGQVWQDKVIRIRSSRDIVVDEKQLRALKEQYQTRTMPE
jgi:peptidyl-prolyl cis-trans isomerase C